MLRKAFGRLPRDSRVAHDPRSSLLQLHMPRIHLTTFQQGWRNSQRFRTRLFDLILGPKETLAAQACAAAQHQDGDCRCGPRGRGSYTGEPERWDMAVQPSDPHSMYHGSKASLRLLVSGCVLHLSRFARSLLWEAAVCEGMKNLVSLYWQQVKQPKGVPHSCWPGLHRLRALRSHFGARSTGWFATNTAAHLDPVGWVVGFTCAGVRNGARWACNANRQSRSTPLPYNAAHRRAGTTQPLFLSSRHCGSQMTLCEVYHVVQPPAQLLCLPNNCLVFSRHEDGDQTFVGHCTAIPLLFCALVR
eukprot:5419005-Amphidinium_carterae.1